MRYLGLILLATLATPVLGQQSDTDYLTTFLQDSLSDAGREVRITGFVGSLSSQAAFETMTIADDAGIWLTLEGVTLDWSQSSLLSGELVITELSAQHLALARWPETDDSALPAPEAAGFSLPELPVSVDIGKIAIARINLAPAVLGQAVEGQLDAALSLAGGAGRAQFNLIRAGDGPKGRIKLEASYDNASRNLDLSLLAGEGEGGLIASALGLPGLPSTDFQIAGAGPIDAFVAKLHLATDGVERLAGTVTLSGDPGAESQLNADLSGNLAPLFLPDYADFLGTQLSLTLDARRMASGAMTIDRFSVKAQSLTLNGRATISAEGAPETVTLTAKLANPDGGPLLLPLSGPSILIDEAAFDITTAQDEGLGWQATGHVLGLALADPALAKAIGPDLTASLKFDFGDGALRLSDLQLAGDGITASGALRVEGLSAAFQTSGDLVLQVGDLSRFDGLAGLSLGGAGEVRLTGAMGLLSGRIDGDAALSLRGFRVGIDQIDRLLGAETRLHLSLLRDETGTTLRVLDLESTSLAASLSGKIASLGIALSGTATISDLGAVDDRTSGAAVLDLSIAGLPQAAKVTLTGTAQDLTLGSAAVDPLLAGESRFSAELAVLDGAVRIDSVRIFSVQADLSATGTADDAGQKLTIAGKLADLGVLIPNLTGALSVSGTVLADGTGYLLDLSARGPGKLDARIAGNLTGDLAFADLAIAGSGDAGLANLVIAPKIVEGPTGFDLRLVGPLDLTSINGRVTLSNGRLSDQDYGFALQDIEGIAELSKGQARITATSGLSTGGKLRVDGTVSLALPLVSDLSVMLDQVSFSDPDLYETVLGGRLAIKGALTGGAMISGALALSETELTVPESGIDAAGILLGITHRNEPADVRATRERAGLLGDGASAKASSGTPYRLDLALSAPGRIFLRGRGIDAELGGELRLGGTSTAIIPAGEFGLIRGRLDILGKRLVLDRADLVLEGSFLPRLAISASTESDGIQSSVSIDGPADDPQVTFLSVPDLPQEEVLAHLLFDRGLSNISALQAAQLAQAVAVLAGRGGAGVIGNLRKSFGLDDLDLAAADDGTAALKAGKYLSDKLYAEVEIDQTGSSTINLNLDLRPGVTVKGGLDASGETGIGIFIESDY